MILKIVREVWYMQSSDVWIHLKNGIDENERPCRIVFMFSLEILSTKPD